MLIVDNAYCEVGGVCYLNKVKQARICADLSVEEAACLLHIPAGYLSQIENGHRQISAARATEIAALYNQRIEDIFRASRYAVREVDSFDERRRS
jgi:transcriptional regulator with XRE-family HTH domain